MSSAREKIANIAKIGPLSPPGDPGDSTADIDIGFKTIIDGLPDGAVIHVGQIIVYANDAAAKILGILTPSKIIGRSYDDIFKNFDFADEAGGARETTGGREPAFRAATLKTSDQGTINVDVRISEIAWRGQPAKLDMLRPSDEREEARHALHDAEIRMAEAMESVAAEFVLWDSNHQFVTCNHLFRKAMPNLVHLMVPGTRYEDFVRARAYDEAYAGNLEDREAWIAERIAEQKAGTFSEFQVKRGGRWMRVYKRPLEDGGSIHFAHDITDHKQAEDELERQKFLFESVFNDVPDAMILADTDRKIFMVNPAFTRIFGYELDEVLGRRADLLYESHKEFERLGRNRFNKDAKEQLEPYEVNFRRKNGDIFPCETVGTVIRDQAGDYLGNLGVVRDITNRKNKDQALQESELRFRSFFENAGVGMTIVELDGRIRLANEAFSRMVGYSRQELRNMRITDLTHSDDREATLKQRDELIKNRYLGGPRDKRYIHKDGHVVWASLNRALITDDDGNPLYTIGQIDDITERKQAEEALLESEQKFRDLANTAADRFWETDQNHQFSYLSPTPGEDEPEPIDHALGRTRWKWANADTGSALWKDHIADLNARRPFRDFRYSRTDNYGHVRHLRTHGTPVFGNDGEFLGYRGTTIEETAEVEARKEAADIQRKFLDAMESASEGVVMWDPDNKLIMCNSHFQEMHSAVGEYLKPGTDLWDFLKAVGERLGIPDKYISMQDWLDEEAAGQGEPVTTFEIVRNGRTFRMRRHRLGDGALIEFMTDITELNRREEKNRQYEAELAHVSRLQLMGEMASGLAHEINQPLAAISNYAKGCAQRIRAGTADDLEIRQVVDKIADQAHRAGEVVKHLRSFIRKENPQKLNIDLNATVREAVEFSRNIFDRRGIVMRLDLAPTLAPVTADRILLQQVLLNLARNGMDAILTGIADSRVITVRTSVYDGRFADISVEDNGVGISPEEMERIFEPFYTTKKDGLGLGLSICQSIIEDHGGKMWAESLEQGVAFHFTIPFGT